MSSKQELLSCPCCESGALDYSADETNPKPSDYIMCNGPSGCWLMIYRVDTQDFDLAGAWNRRPKRAEQEPLILKLAEHRIALLPEYEGEWHAELYGDQEVPICAAEGATPADAINEVVAKAMAAQGGDA